MHAANERYVVVECASQKQKADFTRALGSDLLPCARRTRLWGESYGRRVTLAVTHNAPRTFAFQTGFVERRCRAAAPLHTDARSSHPALYVHTLTRDGDLQMAPQHGNKHVCSSYVLCETYKERT